MSAANRPQGIEIATLTTFDIPALAVLTLEAYDDDVTPEALMETSEELRLTFEGAFGATTEDSFIGAWDGGTLVGAILVVRESPWDDAPDGPFVVDLIVAPDYRRRGIATALISEVATRCSQWGFDSVGPHSPEACSRAQRWQDGHQNRRRFCMSASRIGVPQRRHGRSVR